MNYKILYSVKACTLKAHASPAGLSDLQILAISDLALRPGPHLRACNCKNNR